MNQQNSNTANIPALRFPEFRGEWESKYLKDVSKIGRGKSKHRPRDAEFLYGGSYPFVQTGDIRNSDLYLNTYTQTYSELGLIQSKLWDENTLCITIAANIAETAILKIKACFPDSIIGLTPFENQAEVLFIKYQFDKFKIEIQKLSQGVAQDNLNQEKLSNIVFNFPSLPEQQKIAAFLAAIDEKLQILKKKKSLLEQYKKGVMQKIFLQGLRFKAENGNEFPEWEEKPFGTVYTFITTNSFSRDKLNYDAGKVKNIHYGDIHTKFKTLFDVTKELVPFINEEINLSKFPLNNYSFEGDLIFADASEDYADIGKCLEIVNLENEKVLAGLHTLHARPKSNIMATGFAGYLMKSEKIRLQLMTIAQGSKVLSISTTRLSNINIDIPSIPEQIKIANFLTSLDEKISHCQTQITQTEQYKKGLLQQMFV